MRAISWKASIVISLLIIGIFFVFAKAWTITYSPVSNDFLVKHHGTLQYKVVNVGLEQDQIVGIEKTTGQQIVLIPNVQAAVGMRDPLTLRLLAQPEKSQYIFFQEIKYVGGILAGDNLSGGANAKIQYGYIWKYDQLSNSFSKLSDVNNLFDPEYSSSNQAFVSADQNYTIAVSNKGDKLFSIDLNKEKWTVLGSSANGQSFLDAPAGTGGKAQITWLNPTQISCAIYDSSNGSGDNKRTLLGVQTVAIKR